MTTEDLIRRLEGLNACRDAILWVKLQPDAETAWATCTRPDWMMWYVGMVADQRQVVACTCEIARTVLPHVPTGDLRPLRAIEAAEAWIRGQIEPREVGSAASAADAAVHDYSGSAADAYAAYAASLAAYAASLAAYAVSLASYAAAYVTADAAATTATCDIIRKHFPQIPEDTQ